MPLPKLDIITHSLIVPSTNEEIRIRPFLVKEQKILLTAMVGDDSTEVFNATRQVVNNCVVSADFNIDKLESFDIEYIILQLRCISVGETTKLTFRGKENSSCETCKKEQEVVVNLRDVKVDFSKQKDKKVELTDSVGLIMRYADPKDVAKYAKDLDKDDNALKLIWSCVESVYDADKVTSTKDVTIEEGVEFLNSLTTQQFSKIDQFLEGAPRLTHTLEIKCKECESIDKHEISGLDSFLA